MNESLIKYKLKSLIKKINNRKIVIWGTGNIGKRVANTLTEMNIEVDFFIDIDKKKQGSLFLGKNVCGPEYLKAQNHKIYVMVAFNHYYNVHNQLIEFGYNEELDFHGFGIFARIVVEQIENYNDEFQNSIVGVPNSMNSTVIFAGKNNKLVFGQGVVLNEATIVFHSNDGYCFIGNDSIYKGTIFVGLGCKVIIGERLTVTKNCFISTAEYVEARIGNDCMFASNNEIRCDDGHPIFDIVTAERINKSKSITIGNHVWLAYSAVLLRGTDIGDGSIIGHSSVVKSKIPNNCIAVGAPARVVKKNVAWDNTHLLIDPPYQFIDGEYIEDRYYWKHTRDGLDSH